MDDLSKFSELAGAAGLSGVLFFFALQFWKAYRAQVAAHIKTLKLAARLPLSDDDTLVRKPHEGEAA